MDLLIALITAIALSVSAAGDTTHPELAPVYVAVEYYESGWSTYNTDENGCSIGDYGHSLGAHQWYDRGLGAGYTYWELCDRGSSYLGIAGRVSGCVDDGYSLAYCLQPWTTRWQALRLVELVGDNWLDPLAWLEVLE
jgi:hypothetical protein